MARSVSSAAKDDPRILDYYQSIVGLDLRNSVVRDGEVNRNLLAAWVRNHQPLLSVMPGTAQRISNIDGAQKLVDEATQSAATAASVYKTRSVASLIGGDDPAVAMQSLLNGTSQDAAKFMRLARQDPAAHAGSQKAMADYLADSLLVPRAGATSGEEGVRIASLRALLKSPAKLSVMRSVLGDNAPRALQRVIDDYDLYSTPAMSRLGSAGSRTTPLAYAASQVGQATTGLGRLMQQLLHPVTDSLLALAVHPAAAVPAYLASSASRAVMSKSREAVAQIVAHALVDPKLFMKLTAPIPRGATAEARFMRQMRAMLSAAALQVSPASQSPQN
jgi:hypothetical protein